MDTTAAGRKNLIWNCQLSKAFLKKETTATAFQVFDDILRQEISMVRTISATAIRDAITMYWDVILWCTLSCD